MHARIATGAIAAALLTLPFATYASDACAPGASRVLVNGPQPVVSLLLAAIPPSAGVRFAPGTFDSEQVDYVGPVPKDRVAWQLLHITTTWGEACRATTRLLVFDRAGNYLGNYYGVARPDRVIGDRILFPTGEEIRFDGAEPPARLFVDGEAFSFAKG